MLAPKASTPVLPPTANRSLSQPMGTKLLSLQNTTPIRHLGEIAVSRSGTRTMFDFGEWKSEVASRKNPDGTISFITVAPGVGGAEFTVASGSKRTLTIRDAQHEYVFEER